MLIYIVGFMGAGKTTFGQKLAEANNLSFIDLDHLIEEQHLDTINNLFKQLGEDGFRELEKKALKSTLGLTNTIVATGGGTPCFYNNMEVMLTAGEVVYLKVAPDILRERLKHQKTNRPLISSLKSEELEHYIDANLKLREPYYAQSSITLTIKEVEKMDLSTFFSKM